MRSKKSSSAKKAAVHVVDNGMLSKIVSARLDYNSMGRSVASVTVQTADGVNHTFNAPLSEDLQDEVKRLVGTAMRGLPMQFE